MKHMQVKAELTKDKRAVKVSIMSQSDYATHFGRDLPVGYKAAIWKTRGLPAFNVGNMCMVSHMWDCFSVEHVGAMNEFTWVLLPFRPSLKPATLTMSLDMWDKFKNLVEEYNKWGATQ